MQITYLYFDFFRTLKIDQAGYQHLVLQFLFDHENKMDTEVGSNYIYT